MLKPSKTQFPGDRSAISGLRYYSPSLGRFINKDPIEEQGGLNLYAFCGNNGVNCWDYLGMDPPGWNWRSVISGHRGIVFSGLSVIGGITAVTFGSPIIVAAGTVAIIAGVINGGLATAQALSGATGRGQNVPGDIGAAVTQASGNQLAGPVTNIAIGVATLDLNPHSVIDGVATAEGTASLAENIVDATEASGSPSPKVAPLPDGVKAADNVIQYENGKGGNPGRFTVPNVRPSNQSGVSFYRALYHLGIPDNSTGSNNRPADPNDFVLPTFSFTAPRPAGSATSGSTAKSGSSAPPPPTDALGNVLNPISKEEAYGIACSVYHGPPQITLPTPAN